MFYVTDFYARKDIILKLLLMRHGQTDLNVQKRLQGSCDIPLNENGKNQAKKTHEFMVLNGIVPTKVISSPLGRAIETGHIASGIPIEQVETMPELIEMGFGVYEKRNTEEIADFVEMCFDHPADFTAPEGGEDYDQVLARVAVTIETMRKRIYSGEYSKDDIVLLVSHGATSHGIIEYITKNPREKYWDIDINNCAIIELKLSKDGTSDSYEVISNGFEKNW